MFAGGCALLKQLLQKYWRQKKITDTKIFPFSARLKSKRILSQFDRRSDPPYFSAFVPWNECRRRYVSDAGI